MTHTEQPGSVTVFSRRWLGLSGAYRVTVDEHEAGTISRRRRVRVELSPGRHVVAVWFNGRSSPPLALDLAAGEDALLELGFGPGAFRRMTSREPADQLLLHRVAAGADPAH